MTCMDLLIPLFTPVKSVFGYISNDRFSDFSWEGDSGSS
jgi:hypothetical protein